jgi:hypothetical protein
LNAERAEIFPNLPPRNPTPTPDLRTTVETNSESETENQDPDENNPETLPEQTEQGTTEENPRTDETEQGSSPGNGETENETANGGRSLSKDEQTKEKHIYDLRDKVFANMQKELAKYYQIVIQGNYHLDGFPEISGGIKA